MKNLTEKVYPGIQYSVLLFLVDPDQIFTTTSFTRKQCQVVTMAFNIAKRFHNQFLGFKNEEIHIQKDFTGVFSRLSNFRIEMFKNQRHFRMAARTGKLFLKLFWEALESFQQTHVGFEGTFYKMGNGMETLKYYLDVQNSIVHMSNDEIQETADYIVTNCFLVAQSIGIKNAWGCKPTMILDLSDINQVESFCQRGSRIISQYIEEDIINVTYPPTINDDHFKGNCSLVISADIAVTFSPLDKNKSLIVNGYIASRVLSDMRKQRFNQVVTHYQDNVNDEDLGK